MGELSSTPVRAAVVRLRALWVAVVSISACVSAGAATYYEEQGQLVRAGRSVTALGPDLFGDKVNHYNGALQFVQTDVSLPGSSALPVSIGRRFSGGGPLEKINGYFGRWDLEIPRVHGVFAAGTGFKDGWGGNDRCSKFSAPPPFVSGVTKSGAWAPREYWRGNMLYVPGVGDQEILKRSLAYSGAPSDGNMYPLLTRDRWMIRCIPLAQGTGEGFLAISPEGVEYRFDWMVSREMPVLERGTAAPGPSSQVADRAELNEVGGAVRPDGYLLNRFAVSILPTQIKDRFGNTVRFEFSVSNASQLLKIVSSDGRQIDLSYENATSRRIRSVSDGSRIWTYQYDPDGDLSEVVQPDQSRWTFSGTKYFLSTDGLYTGAPGCYGVGQINPALAKVTMTHPSGVKGEFTTQNTEHARAFVEKRCFGPSEIYSNSPTYYALPSLVSKTLSGPGLPAATWQYSYSPAAGSGSYSDCSGNCPETRWTLVKEPSGLQKKFTYGIRADKNEGLLLQTEQLNAGGQILRTDATSYRAWDAGPYPAEWGVSIIKFGNDAPSTRVYPAERRTVALQGTSFTWQVESFDSLARPLTVTRSGPGGSRSETTSYSDNTSLWVLGQVDTITSNGQTVVDNDYFPSNAMLRSSSKFGVFQHSFTYNTDGTLASRTDGRNHTTYFNNYKLGLPQSVSYPDDTSESAEVSDLGLVTRVTSAAGYTTDYGYDSMGRLASISPPSGWAATSLSFEQVWAPEYGLPAGHWRQTISKGNARTVTYYDAFWRPVMTRSFDAGDEANTRKVTVKSYDADGRVTFESYPQRDFSTVAVTSPGKRSSYDALGRLKQQDADSELGTLSSTTEYLSGFQVRHTNPRGKQSTQTLWALDNPSESQLSAISVPAGGGLPGGMSVSIARDAFGKPTSITRSGNGASVTRSYVYDAGQRLCKTVEPEVGATIQDYDAAGNIAWRAPGVGYTGLGSCDQASVPAAARISHGYDAVNQLTSTSYGDGSPSVTRAYWPDGKLKTVSTGSGDSWSYTYNALRLLDTETFSYAGQSFAFSWGYDGNGSLSSLSYPTGGPVITYLPNALGEPSRVGGYATAVKFHPNGAVSDYTLGNSIAHSLTQNLRGLPLVNRDAGVMQDQYSYDANGNVTAIADQQEAGLFNRAMSYDDLDRLWTANAPGVWGNATYTYDALDNLKTAVVGNRSSTLNYDASNKLSNIVTNGSTANYLYDPRGNVNKKGLQTFEFDLGNRLKSSSLGGGYLYDGHGRRIQITGNDGVKRLQLYSQAGQILWSETASAGSIPATLSYVCAVGTPVNGQCVSTSTYPATQNYGCNPGDEAPVGNVCTHVTSSTYAATITGYSCNAGDGAAVNGICYHTTTSTYAATVTGYSCNSGDGPAVNGICTHVTSSSYQGTVSGYTCNPGDAAPVGGVCTHTVSSTYAGTPTGYGCNVGDGAPVSGVCTHTTVLSAATPVYVCPAGFTLSGTTCSREVPSNPLMSFSCNGNGQPRPHDGGLYGQACKDGFVVVDHVSHAPSACFEEFGSYGLTFRGVQSIGSTGKKFACIYDPIVTVLGCPPGSTLNSSTNQCMTPEQQPATFDHFHCSNGTVSGSNCIATNTYSATPTGYSCNAGDGQPSSGGICTHVSSTIYPGTVTGYTCNAGDGAAVNGVCTHTTTSTYAATVNGYSCNPGDGPAVNGTCTHTSTSSYAGTPSGYSCNPGDGAPSNGQCTHVVRSTYAAILQSSTCNAGDGSASNGVCTHTTILGAASPVYSCPSGATPTPQHTCPGATTRVGTAYIYLGGKQIAEVVVGGATQYVHTDALGSPVAHTNASGGLLNRTRYEAYGFTAAGTKPGPNTSSIGFTGHVNDPETDLVYMQQRYYDPIAGRFLSVDPIVTDANTGKGFSLYAYVENSPYAKIDPDGRRDASFTFQKVFSATLFAQGGLGRIGSAGKELQGISISLSINLSATTDGYQLSATASGVELSGAGLYAGGGLGVAGVVSDGITAPGISTSPIATFESSIMTAGGNIQLDPSGASVGTGGRVSVGAGAYVAQGGGSQTTIATPTTNQIIRGVGSMIKSLFSSKEEPRKEESSKKAEDK